MEKEPNLHAGHRQRMKARFLEQGSGAFSDHQLLEMLLFYSVPRRDTNPLAHRLMNTFHTLSGVLNASVEELTAVDGVSEHTAILIHLSLQIFQRYRTQISDGGQHAFSIEDVAEYLRPYFFGSRNERIFLVSLDSADRILGCDCLNEGEVNYAWLDSRTLVSHALRSKAAGVVLAHCHPLGSPEPSDADCLTTRHCKKILQALNIQLIDHLVFADDQWVSMAKLNLID